MTSTSDTTHHRRPDAHPARQGLVDFLDRRLREDLARVWARGDGSPDRAPRPGMAAQVQVIDDLLGRLDRGLLPHRRDLRILLAGYGAHRDYDPHWTDFLAEA